MSNIVLYDKELLDSPTKFKMFIQDNLTEYQEYEYTLLLGQGSLKMLFDQYTVGKFVHVPYLDSTLIDGVMYPDSRLPLSSYSVLVLRGDEIVKVFRLKYSFKDEQ